MKPSGSKEIFLACLWFGFGLGGCTEKIQVNVRNEGPLTAEAAKTSLYLRIPQCVKNVWFIEASDRKGQFHDYYVSLDAPDCDLATVVPFLAEEFGRLKAFNLSYARGEVGVAPTPDPDWGDARWWDVKSIKRGYSLTSDQSVTLWIDEDRKKIYIHAHGGPDVP
jgi:hypothetical protein